MRSGILTGSLILTLVLMSAWSSPIKLQLELEEVASIQVTGGSHGTKGSPLFVSTDYRDNAVIASKASLSFAVEIP